MIFNQDYIDKKIANLGIEDKLICKKIVYTALYNELVEILEEIDNLEKIDISHILEFYNISRHDPSKTFKRLNIIEKELDLTDFEIKAAFVETLAKAVIAIHSIMIDIHAEAIDRTIAKYKEAAPS